MGDEENQKEAGICIDYAKLNSSILVKFENVKRPLAVQKSKVRPTCKVGHPKNFILNDDLLQVFELFLIPPEIELSIPEPPPKPKEEEEPAEPQGAAEEVDPFKVS